MKLVSWTDAGTVKLWSSVMVAVIESPFDTVNEVPASSPLSDSDHWSYWVPPPVKLL